MIAYIIDSLSQPQRPAPAPLVLPPDDGATEDLRPAYVETEADREGTMLVNMHLAHIQSVARATHYGERFLIHG